MKFKESAIFSPADYAIEIMMYRYERPDLFNEAYIQGLYNGIALLGGVKLANAIWKEILNHRFTGSPVTFL